MSKIEEFFEKISGAECPTLKTKECKTIGEFYNQLEEMNCFPSEDSIIKWHNLLKEYIKDKDAMFFIRRYASDKKDGKWDTRRGLQTKVQSNDGRVLRYVFVDNFFAQYFFAMAYNNFVPELEDLKEFINSKTMPYGYLDTEEERPYQTYKTGNQYPLNKHGWKLSHVYSANGNDYDFNYKKEKTELFPKGEYNDWDNNDKIRVLDPSLSEDVINKIKAHFLRVVHPINYFLTPKSKLQTSERGITDIGEYPPMIEYRKEKIINSNLKDIFEEYKKLIFADDCDPDPSNRNIMLSYEGVEKKENSNNVTSKNSSRTSKTKSQNKTTQSKQQNNRQKISYDASLVTKTAADREAYLLNVVHSNYVDKSGLKKLTEINGIVNSLFSGKSLFDLTNAQDIIEVWKEVKKQPWNKKAGNGIPQSIVSNYCMAVTGQAPRK